VATPEQRLARAIEHHRHGRLEEAAALYESLIGERPEDANALHLLGVVSLQRGDANRAVELIGRALALHPGVADFHNNMGEAHRALGALDFALGHYREAVRLDARHADAHNNLGVALKAKGALEPAETHFRRAIAIAPSHPRAHNNLGTVLRALGQYEEAERELRRAVEIAPAYSDAHSNLGNVLWALEARDEALASQRKALELDPRNADAMVNIGTALNELGEGDSATAFYRQAIACRPDFADAHYNLANNLADHGELALARECYLRALALEPEHVEAHGNLARLDLLAGRFAEGFDRWKWRWREPDTWSRSFDHRVWDGAPLDGRTLLVWCEQGVGDELMLASVLGDAIAAAGRVVVECDARLVPLFERSFPRAEFVARDEPPAARLKAPDIDLQCALGSLCRWLRRDAAAFADASAYLEADPARVEALRARYAALGPGPKIGIAWRSVARGEGPRNKRFSARKSTALADWGPVLLAGEACFVNLQYGEVAEDLAEVERRFAVRVFDDERVDQMASLDDFAAQIAALDLVVSASNTAVHMAGALGQEVWTIVPFVPDWRWQMGREDTLWYPRMRLFRQPAPGDWASVLARVGAELGGRIG
jgi:Tfp pilus assembly protein PilF